MCGIVWNTKVMEFRASMDSKGFCIEAPTKFWNVHRLSCMYSIGQIHIILWTLTINCLCYNIHYAIWLSMLLLSVESQTIVADRWVLVAVVHKGLLPYIWTNLLIVDGRQTALHLGHSWFVYIAWLAQLTTPFNALALASPTNCSSVGTAYGDRFPNCRGRHPL